jgi:recombination protein RecA
VSSGVIKKSGAFFDYSGTKLGQGREKAREYLVQHPEIAGDIEKNIRQVAAGVPVSGHANKESSE